MDSILSLLITERNRIQQAIDILQSEPKRRGSPPKKAGSKFGLPTPFKNRRRRSRMSAQAREQQSQRMKAYWAAKKKGPKKGK